jgi:hypothetical protein
MSIACAAVPDGLRVFRGMVQLGTVSEVVFHF